MLSLRGSIPLGRRVDALKNGLRPLSCSQRRRRWHIMGALGPSHPCTWAMTLSPIHSQNEEHHRRTKRAGSSWKIVQAQQREQTRELNIAWRQPCGLHPSSASGRQKGECCSGHKNQSPDELSPAKNHTGICQYSWQYPGCSCSYRCRLSCWEVFAYVAFSLTTCLIHSQTSFRS